MATPRSTSRPVPAGAHLSADAAGLGAATRERLLNAAEVAQLLAVPVSWVRETTRAGRMPVVHLGRYTRYDRADVQAWLDSCKTPGSPVAFRRHDPRRPS